eukprot:CAMPEP_0194770324 /NCGR_PEP_ID=MMETSP0323_2-20130528/45911_1 /TAXON_ID=2866 ORGANISM="Crypthecodinium cohnii, Strain Seligo" /NCGR_SAMPLE_ID=MMETSP0323_2 /ASSEMBLY_ACC=CAM_ASM_000346 /LENGTH=91 /DNA_ID=CAMNT_0039703839 /DNA_START=23 /DNA_END=298 /DNA_ORIENTATION=-
MNRAKSKLFQGPKEAPQSGVSQVDRETPRTTNFAVEASEAHSVRRFGSVPRAAYSSTHAFSTSEAVLAATLEALSSSVCCCRTYMLTWKQR